MRVALGLLALLALLLAGCGGGGSTSDAAAGEPTSTTTETLESLWNAPGEDVAIVAGTSDYAPGANRVTFLVVDGKSRVVATPTARVWVARDLEAAPFLETRARLERIGVPGGSRADASELYVTTVDLPGPGKYWLLAEPAGAESPIQALGNLVVGKTSAAPGVGDSVPASKTPTLASTRGDLDRLTTSRRPDRELYRISVAEALASGRPFVVSFATPLYCQTRTCGPVVDVVSAVRRKLANGPTRFIHVEIYRDNDPAKGPNRWVREWKLPTEPFTFVVGRDGTVAAKLEGAFSARELVEAVRRAQRS
jgi:hypothetical protein